MLPVPEAPTAFPLERERWGRVVRDARRLLGRPVHLSLHPGGIVITPMPTDSYAPVQWAAKGVMMTQFEKDAIEYIGLVKIDLLGNRALSTVDEAQLHARVAVPMAPTIAHDPLTVEMARTADTLGVTQLESPAMRNLLLQMQAESLDDIIQALALLRPGAASIGMKERFIRRRQGLETINLSAGPMERLLGETHGLMLYEDDALRLIQALTGLSPADADRLRKRISKHRTEEEAEALRQEFLRACVRMGTPTEGLGELWQQLAKFNRYSFCKSHAVSYGLIAWQAVYLKAHHPLAFWTAVLNNNQGAYMRWVYIEAIKRAGIEVRLPCVNRSGLFFQPEGDDALRTGLEAIAGLPRELRLALVAERDRNGPYHDLGDLRRRVAIGPEALAILIRAGAMDFTGKGRPALVLEARLQDAWGEAAMASRGRRSPVDIKHLGHACLPGTGVPGSPLAGELFAIDPTEGWSPPDDPPERRWRDEWQSLGFVIGPPLFTLFARPVPPVRGVPLISSSEVTRFIGRLVRVQGLVATARHVVTAENRSVQFVTLHDEHGMTEVTLFSGTCAQVPYLTLGPYVAQGVVEERFGSITLTARRFERMGGG
jgi:DNA polymerase III alpha subunit